MACILKPECNFLHGYFRCLLPLENVDIEVKVKMMRGFHMFRRDGTTLVISCIPWSTRLHPYPSLIRKMKIYLKLEGKLGPKPKPQPQLQPCTSTPSHDRNSLTRKTLVPKKGKKKRRAKTPVKRRYKVRVIARPMPATPTSPMNPILPAEPTATVATSTTTTQMPVVKSTATSIPLTVYNLVQGKFEGIPYPTGRPQVQENPSTPSCNIPQQSQQPEGTPTAISLQAREDTSWSNTMPAPQTCLRPGHLGYFPQLKHPQLLRWRKQKIHPG